MRIDCAESSLAGLLVIYALGVNSNERAREGSVEENFYYGYYKFVKNTTSTFLMTSSSYTRR